MARVVCDIVNLDGSPFEGDPVRCCAGRWRGREALGFFLLRAPRSSSTSTSRHVGRPGRSGAYPARPGLLLRAHHHRPGQRDPPETVLTLEDMGIPVEYSQHEDAPSQHEIDLRYTDALTMADTVMTVRMVVKEIAAPRGILATFMPKPLFGVQGSGMHTHMSLFDGDNNAFYDDADEYNLSTVARRFIAGMLIHAAELTAVTNQWVNSYKRLIIGYEAPVYISWARNNRSALVRVPPTKRGKRDSTRIEYRAPDSAANPYLAFAAVLAAGLAGIERGYDLPAEAAANLYELSPAQRLAEGIDSLPGSLAEAVTVWSNRS